MDEMATFLDRSLLSLIRDLAYEEYDRVTSGSTIYAHNEETVQDLLEILDIMNETLED
jgi:hypothetical protein